MKRLLTTLAQKWPEYLLEVLVITVGILGAFTLNNWNENRKGRIQEQAILKNLHSEFVYNKAQFKVGQERHDSVYNACREIISKFPLNSSKVKEEDFRHFMDETFNYWTFNPAQGTINSLISSGNFNLIRDDNLRKLILSWPDILHDFQEDELGDVKYVRDIYGPYINSHLPYLFDFDDPRIDFSVFASIKFENMIYERANNVKNILGNTEDEAQAINDAIEKIISLSEKNIIE